MKRSEQKFSIKENEIMDTKKSRKKKKAIKSKAKKVGREVKKAVKTDVGRAGIGGGIGALALGPIGAVAGAGIAMATKKKNPSLAKSIKEKRARSAAGRVAKTRGAASEVSRRSLQRRLAKLNPESLSQDKTLNNLTKDYIKGRVSHLNLIASPGSSASSIARAEKRKNDAERKLILYAEIRGLEPRDLQELVEDLSAKKTVRKSGEYSKENPLKSIPKGASQRRAKSVISENIATEIEAGRPQKQAVAIALNKARRDAPGLIDSIYGPKPNPYYGDAVELAKMRERKKKAKVKPPPPPKASQATSKKIKPLPGKNPKNKSSESSDLIKHCHTLWDAYCKNPTKKNLEKVFTHLEKMKKSKSDKVKKERSRCFTAAKKETGRMSTS